MTNRLENHKKFARLLFVTSFFLVSFYFLRPIFAPLALASILSLMVLPFARFLERHRLNRGLSSILAVAIPGLIFGGLLILAYFQLTKLSGEVKNIESAIVGRLNDFTDMLPVDFRPQHMRKLSEVEEMLPQNSSWGQSAITGTLSALSSLVSTIIIVPVFMVFTLIFRGRARDFISECDKVFGTRLGVLTHESESVVQSYIAGLGLVTLIIGTMATLGLWIIGIPYALLLGIFSAFLAIVPYVGTFIGSLIPIIFAFAVKDSYGYGLGVMALYLGIQLIDNNFVSPYILGNKVNINPLASILGLTSFYLFWGLIGMAIAIPVMAILQILMSQTDVLRPFALLIRHNPEEDRQDAD